MVPSAVDVVLLSRATYLCVKHIHLTLYHGPGMVHAPPLCPIFVCSVVTMLVFVKHSVFIGFLGGNVKSFGEV